MREEMDSLIENDTFILTTLPEGRNSEFYLACTTGVFLVSERSVLLREMCGRHLALSKQKKIGERKKFLPRGWSIDQEGGRGGERKISSRLSLPIPSLPTFTEIKHDGSANYR